MPVTVGNPKAEIGINNQGVQLEALWSGERTAPSLTRGRKYWRRAGKGSVLFFAALLAALGEV